MKLLSVSMALTVAVLGPTSISSVAQWGAGVCVSVDTPISVASIREWKEISNDPGRVHLFVGGVQKGAWCPWNQMFWDFDPINRKWSPPKSPPSDLPIKYRSAKVSVCGCSDGCSCPKNGCKCQETNTACSESCSCSPTFVLPQWMTHGVDQGKVQGSRCEINGQPVTPDEAKRSITDPSIPNDEKNLDVTVIGPKEIRERVLRDLQSHPSFSWFRDKINPKGFSPDNWHVQKYGFVSTGNPTIYVQSGGASGKVLHRQDDYSDGPEGLAGALRKVHPDYKPEKDPDQRKSDTPFPIPNLPDWLKDLFKGENNLLVLGGLMVLIFLFRKK